MSNAQLKVIFRKFKKGGDIIALFPTVPHDRAGIYCQSYQHTGQHGAADYHGVIADSVPAEVSDYSELAAELVRIGYDKDELRIMEKATYADHKQRREAAK